MNHKHYISAGLTLALCLTGGCNTKAITTGTTGSKDMNGPEVSISLEKKDHKGQLNSMESQGIALIRKGQLDRAYEVYEKIAGLSYYRGREKHMTPLSVMLQDIHDYGDMSQSVEWCRNFVEENPSLVNWVAAHNMAVIFAKTNNFEEAVAIMKPFIDSPDVGLDFVHDYGMYCLDILEHNRIDEGPRRDELLSRAYRSVEIIREKWGETPNYYIALGEYYTVLRDFKKATQAYEMSIKLRDTESNPQEGFLQLADASLLKFELGILTQKPGNDLSDLNRMLESFEHIDPYTYDRFFTDRMFAILLSEFYMNEEPIKSWQIEKIIGEHKKMEEKGMHQPRQLKILHDEMYKFLANREKGDHQKAVYHLNRAIRFFKVTQDCPAYHPVHIPLVVSMLHGFQGDLYARDGQTEEAKKAYAKALEYLPANQIARRELDKLAN